MIKKDPEQPVFVFLSFFFFDFQHVPLSRRLVLFSSSYMMTEGSEHVEELVLDQAAATMIKGPLTFVVKTGREQITVLVRCVPGSCYIFKKRDLLSETSSSLHLAAVICFFFLC